MSDRVMKRRTLFSAFLAALICASHGRGADFSVTIDAGTRDLVGVPVAGEIKLPAGQGIGGWTYVFFQGGGDGAPQLGQILPPGLAARESGENAAELRFVVPSLKAGETMKLSARSTNKPFGRFSWSDTPGKSTELRFDDRPVLRYMYEAVDNSSKERRGETYKVYHHVFDPEGDRLLTKGPGGLFPHHRGLFYGFNKISYGDQKADIWHCNNGEWQAHVKVISLAAGLIFGRHRVAIDWHGRDGKVFAKEERELTAYTMADAQKAHRGAADLPAGTLIEFASRLTSQVGPLKLDGDPQHAGFQFRASQEVPDKTAKQTYYLRPDGKGEPGTFRNWPKDKAHENLPWNAMSFVLGDQRYTAVYLDHPKNPKPARYSERDYGRFGSYFVAELDEGKPLTVNYRIWIQRGEMTVEQCEALSKAFVEPAKVTVAVK
ncbi:MAG: DUF6807 family protein [Pirellulales bacterium]